MTNKKEKKKHNLIKLSLIIHLCLLFATLSYLLNKRIVLSIPVDIINSNTLVIKNNYTHYLKDLQIVKIKEGKRYNSYSIKTQVSNSKDIHLITTNPVRTSQKTRLFIKNLRLIDYLKKKHKMSDK
ncbi:MAG: hypothetical protein VW378_00660 [bacterium]